MSEDLLYDEKKLLAEIAGSSESAFRKVFDIYRDKLYSFIFKLSNSKQFAEDSVHDVFLKIWLSREKLPEVRNLNAYLFRMARNHAYNGLRRMATEELVMEELQNQSASIKDTDDKLVKKEVKQFIHQAVNNLTPQQKQVFGMSWEEGLKQEEIARKLNISILTVKRHLTDARNFLRKQITLYSRDGIVLFIIYLFS